MGESENQFERVRLVGADEAALEALVGAGYDPAALGSSGAPDEVVERALRLARVLGALDAPTPIGDRALVDVAFLRAMREPAGGASPSVEMPDLARLLTSGAAFDEGARRRLVARTLGTIERAAEAEAERMNLAARLAARGAGRLPSISIRDVVSVAAVLLIASSVVWPVLSHMREESRRAACNSNLGATSHGLASYALDYQSAMPMVAGFGGGRPWWNVGAAPLESNSANLYALSREGYVSLASLACPGNERAPTVPSGPEQRDWRTIEEVSYSYQIVPLSSPLHWGDSHGVVMTDRSPVILRAVRGEPIDPWANSPNHDGRGQHVVLADGSVGWLSTPEIGVGADRWRASGSATGDNIWLPRQVERVIDRAVGRRRVDPIKGTEVPESPDDAFVGP